jgi:YD repeat-containing protein
MSHYVAVFSAAFQAPKNARPEAGAARELGARDASGRITGTVTTDSNGTKTFRDGSGRTTGTATTDSNGTTTFRDASGRTTGTASRPRR